MMCFPFPDTGKAQEHLEAMERARQKMQEQLDRQAAEYKLKQQEVGSVCLLFDLTVHASPG